ncbi:MAG: nucleoside kinase [Bacillota bacterium]
MITKGGSFLSTAIKISTPHGEESLARGGALKELADKHQKYYGSPIVAAKVNNEIKELFFKPEEDTSLSWLDLSDEDGVRIYCRSLCFVMIRAAREIFDNCRVTVEHSLSKGIYCELYCGRPITEKDIRALEAKMHEIIDADEPIVKMEVPVAEAVEIFRKDGQEDKVRLLKFRRKEKVKIYRLGWFHDYFYGYMAPSTGYLKKFGLKYYLPGFILQFPRQEDPGHVAPFVEQRKLSRVFYEAEKWAEILDVDDVGALDGIIASGQAGDFIRVSEALHEKKIAQIADMIAGNRERVHLILIAGPSCSGKTTFAQRLSIQLRVNGLKPVAVSIDDYFLDREFTPRDEKGNYDFESIDAIDVGLFNEHLSHLIQGQPVEIPFFNFHTGKREWQGRILKTDQNQPLIIEGIHGLNEYLTQSIPKESKYKIYVSALTQLNIDDHNRIPTTDNRLIRRIVRDYNSRSRSALETIRTWPSVRRGEEKNIFPFQEEADVMFNTALLYELAVLKKFAEPLLSRIGKDVPEFSEAKRLLKFFSYFLSIDDACEIPSNSILREFIGNSCF